MNPRFNPDCNTFDEVLEYYTKRAMQLKRERIEFISIKELEFGAVAFFIDNRHEIYHYSLYLYKDFRGQGFFGKFNVNEHLPRGYQNHNFLLLTSDDCGLTDYLLSKNITYRNINLYSYDNNIPYRIVSEHYGAGKAKRSGVDFMNHIDEAYALINNIDFQFKHHINTIRAYCLHPIFQMDLDLYRVSEKINSLEFMGINLDDIMNVIEYRSVANEYLSHREINSIEEIRLSPLQVVNQMLILDKIQNRKDFDLYHKGIHPRSAELTKYFDNWFKRLGITNEMYDKCLQALVINPTVYKK